MFKLLVILGIIGFALYKLNQYYLLLISPFVKKEDYNSGRKSKREGEIEIDYVSEAEEKRRKNSRNFKGGEYIDFEEEKE